MAVSIKPIVQEQRGDLFRVDSRLLVVDEDYIARENYGDIPGFAKSIRALGIQYLPPLQVYRKEGKYVIIRGHRRLKAIKIIEQDGEVIMVPVIIEATESRGGKIARSLERRYLEQATENDGLAYSPWEKAKVLGRMVNSYGWTDEQLIEETGWSNVYVRRLLSLFNAPKKLINLVRKGTVTGTLAMDMIAEGRVQELIDKAEQSADPLQSPEFLEMFPPGDEVPAPNPPRITRSDLKPNSWKTFRKWSSKVDVKELPPKKAELFNWLNRMAEGELTEDDFADFFS